MRRTLLAALPAILFACGSEEPVVVVVLDSAEPEAADGGSPSPEPSGVPLHRVSWQVDWDPTGLELLDDGGWRVERADGAALEETEGYLVVFRLVLEPCEAPSARHTPPPHGYAEHPSGSRRPVALSMHDLASVSLGAATFDSDVFCETGVTVFQGAEGDLGMPEDGLLDGRSFWLTGRLRRGPDGPWEDFTMASQLSAEHDLPLVGWAEGSGHVEVVLQARHVLDGLSLDQHPERVSETLWIRWVAGDLQVQMLILPSKRMANC